MAIPCIRQKYKTGATLVSEYLMAMLLRLYGTEKGDGARQCNTEIGGNKLAMYAG